MKKHKKPQKIILRNHQSPGDTVTLAFAIKALHEQYPGFFITDVDTPSNAIFEGNPYITPLDRSDISVRVLEMDYPTINESNQKPYRMVNGFVHSLGKKLNIHLEPTEWIGAIWITPEEQSWFSAIREKLGYDPPYWVVDAGVKQDYSLKAWDFSRYQEVINRFPEVWFVQIGHKDHVHPEMKGQNVINLVGQTDLRQLIRLIWNSFGVITPVSLPMHLAYAVPPHPRFNRKSRACVVIAGGREPNHWEEAANQQFLHTCGMLPCCDLGGCWLCRAMPSGDGDEKDKSLCLNPVTLPSGQVIGKCFNMITADEVCNPIKKYMDNLGYISEKPA